MSARAACSADAGALTALYDDALVATGRRFPSLDAEGQRDVVHAAMVRVLGRLSARPVADLRTCLVSALGVAGAAVVRERRRPDLSLDGIDAGGRRGARVDAALQPLSVDEQAVAGCELAAIARLLASELGADERRALLLRRLAGRSPSEIAAAMQVSEQRCRTLLKRGAYKLRIGLAREFDADALVLHAAGAASPADRKRALELERLAARLPLTSSVCFPPVRSAVWRRIAGRSA